jgi:hypothetical protein
LWGGFTVGVQLDLKQLAAIAKSNCGRKRMRLDPAALQQQQQQQGAVQPGNLQQQQQQQVKTEPPGVSSLAVKLEDPAGGEGEGAAAAAAAVDMLVKQEQHPSLDTAGENSEASLYIFQVLFRAKAGPTSALPHIKQPAAYHGSGA